MNKQPNAPPTLVRQDGRVPKKLGTRAWWTISDVSDTEIWVNDYPSALRCSDGNIPNDWIRGTRLYVEDTGRVSMVSARGERRHEQKIIRCNKPIPVLFNTSGVSTATMQVRVLKVRHISITAEILPDTLPDVVDREVRLDCQRGGWFPHGLTEKGDILTLSVPNKTITHVAKPAPADSPEVQPEHTPRSQGKSCHSAPAMVEAEHVVFVYSDGDGHTANSRLTTDKYDASDAAVGIILNDVLAKRAAMATLAMIPEPDGSMTQYILINTPFAKSEVNLCQPLPEYNPGTIIPLLIAQTYVENRRFSHQDKTTVPPEEQSVELMALPDKASGVLTAMVVKQFDDTGKVRKIVFDDYPDRAALINWNRSVPVGCVVEVDVDNSKVLSVSYPGHVGEPAIVERAASKGNTLLG